MNEDLPADEAAMVAEMNRIYGAEPIENFVLLPFHSIRETLAFLRRVPDRTGDAGIRAGLEQFVQTSDPKENAP